MYITSHFLLIVIVLQSFVSSNRDRATIVKFPACVNHRREFVEKKKRGEDFSSIFPKIDEMGGERGIHLSLGGLPSITFSILLHALLI